MPEDLELALVAFVAVCAALGVLIGFGRRGPALAFADEREEQLTRRLASQLGCPLTTALAAVRKELGIAPTASDETILKRAAYHYCQNLPEPGGCGVYRDRAPR
jgi:hypothetical protein